MSDRSLEGVDAEGAAVFPQSDVVHDGEHLPVKSQETDSVYTSEDAVTAVNAAVSYAPIPVEAHSSTDSCRGSNENPSSSMNRNNTESCSAVQQLSASEATAREASGAAAASCAKNFDGFCMDDLETMIARQRELVNRVRTEREDFLRRTELAKAEIERAAQRLYGAVDNRVNEVLAAADELRSQRTSQLEQARSEMQTSMAAMNYHRHFAQQLLKHGTPAEVTRYAPLLHADAERICNEPIPAVPPMSSEAEEKLASLQAFASLSLEEIRQQVQDNVVGHVARTEAVDASADDGVSPYLGQPRLIAATAVDNGVCGVAFLDVNLFVLRDRSSVVEVFTASEGLVPLRQINVEQMSCPTSIAACTSANCIFITDSQVLNSCFMRKMVKSEKHAILHNTYICKKFECANCPP